MYNPNEVTKPRGRRKKSKGELQFIGFVFTLTGFAGIGFGIDALMRLEEDGTLFIKALFCFGWAGLIFSPFFVGLKWMLDDRRLLRARRREAIKQESLGRWNAILQAGAARREIGEAGHA